MIKKVSWKFPSNNVLFLRIEAVFLAFMTVFVLMFSYIEFGYVFVPALIATILFVALYVIVSHGANIVRKVEEYYHLYPTHLEVVRKTRTKVKTEKVPLKDIRHHKLDKTFLGGYVVSKKGKHLLFFNNLKELEKFESFFLEHWKKKKR
ncbi:hypothetical protein J4444_01565 [Candidatus Woesearchaeota archaeon]|nr:hypothetical protein [Candidatus Woesearchaeota archaeon]